MLLVLFIQKVMLTPTKLFIDILEAEMIVYSSIINIVTTIKDNCRDTVNIMRLPMANTKLIKTRCYHVITTMGWSSNSNVYLLICLHYSGYQINYMEILVGYILVYSTTLNVNNKHNLQHNAQLSLINHTQLF